MVTGTKVRMNYTKKSKDDYYHYMTEKTTRTDKFARTFIQAHLIRAIKSTTNSIFGLPENEIGYRDKE